MDEVYINNIKFSVSSAITDSEQQVGLMWKQWPPSPMVFPYKSSNVRRFWMKNTPSPLDIVFCCNNKIISIAKGVPNSTSMVGPEQPVDLVLEFPYGTMEKMAISVGDTVKLKFATETAAKFLLKGCV